VRPPHNLLTISVLTPAKPPFIDVETLEAHKDAVAF
jgi:hypothetical protein